MKFIYIFLVSIILISCSTKSITQYPEIQKINLLDRGEYIEVRGDNFIGSIILNNKNSFIDELIFYRKDIGVVSISREYEFFKGDLEIFDSSGYKIGQITSLEIPTRNGVENIIRVESLKSGKIYKSSGSYNGNGYLEITQEGQKVISIRNYDYTRMSIIVYSDTELEILIHIIKYIIQ